jgi:hypothetical protein
LLLVLRWQEWLLASSLRSFPSSSLVASSELVFQHLPQMS